MDAEIIYRGTEAFNREVEGWASKVEGMLRSKVQSESSKGTGELARKLKKQIRMDSGEAESIIYKFPRHGVFFAKGVGRGHIMQNGKVVRGVRNNKTIRYLSGPVNRQPKDWWSKVLDQEVSNLADIVANYKADEAVVNSFKSF